MSSHDQAHPHGDLVNVDVHHEETDINLRALVWFVVMLTATVLAVDVVCYGMFKLMNRYEASNEPYVTPLAVPIGQDPPQPQLQTTPWTDLRTFRAEQHDYLHGYGWVDEKLGVARIPIERAKEMLLQRGIAVRPELADAAEGTHVAATGESNSARGIPAAGPDRSTVPAPAAAAPPPAAPQAAPAAKKTGGGE